MKQFFTFVALLLTTFASLANDNDGKVSSQTSSSSSASVKVMNAGAVRFQFKNIDAQDHADSMLVIFDRFDHTGAGVIYQVYAADQQSGVDISAIPAGKYYVTIQCMGLHHDQIQKTITVKKNKNEKFNIVLTTTELFSKDNVVIPASNTSLTNLSILNSK